MLVCGKNILKEVINNNIEVYNCYLREDFNDKEVINTLNKNHIHYSFKKQRQMDLMTTEHHQGVILEIPDIDYFNIDDIVQDKDANFVVILDHIEDPHNYGAIIRTCECAGVDYIVVPNKRNALVTSAVVRASSGAVMNAKIVQVANLVNSIEKLKKNGYWVVGTDADGENYTDIDYSGKSAIVVGSEGFGIKPLVRKSCDFIASIPLKGKVNSLNASVAAGIIIYEVAKTK